MEKLTMQTPNPVDKNVEQIAGLFPEVITEIKDNEGNLIKGIDFDLLKQKLSNVLVEDENERYRLDWPGKKASLLKANTPITKTLRPVVEESVNFDNTENLFIEGDNFEVLKIIQESYLGKVKMIYIDPPYNTGTSMIYNNDFKIGERKFAEELGAITEDGVKMFKNNDTDGRIHSNWLSFMYERIYIARDILEETGIICVTIDDYELPRITLILDQIFGEENRLGTVTIVHNPRGRSDDTYFATSHEYALVYSKNSEMATTFLLNLTEEQEEDFPLIDEISRYRLLPLKRTGSNSTPKERPNLYYPIYFNPETNKIGLVKEIGFVEIFPLDGDDNNRVWRWGKDAVEKRKDTEIVVKKNKENHYSIFAKDRIKEGRKPKTVWVDPKYDASSHGTMLLQKIFGIRKSFDYPKSLYAVKDILEVGLKHSKNAIVLDFFSGSATTAHALMQLNAEDQGTRKFIMVQLPEQTDKSSIAFENGYKTICDIGKERIRRAGKKIKEEFYENFAIELEKLDKVLEREALHKSLDLVERRSELEAKIEHIKNLDIGFRVYRSDTSNMHDVFYHPSDIRQEQLSAFESNIKEDRTPEDLLTQVILDLGLELSLSIEKREIHGNQVFVVQGNALIACFDDKINFAIVDKIADLKPLRVVYKDSSFMDDKERINVEERFNRLSPDTIITVI